MVRVESFLERSLLLVDSTPGQPACGTEILNLRYMNSIQGHHRSVFTKNGMVSMVTSYHKGCSVTGSIKIILRYLPKEVGELLTHYLWLVLPFCQALELVSHSNKTQPSPFNLAKGRGGELWNTHGLARY